jgi:hypothetical protein
MPAAAKNDEAITVRMYRGILGDCFLLTHSRGKARFHALIDCGVLQCIGNSRPLTKASLGTMPSVVQDLFDTTGGRLDLVIATHEHYDHLSGFILENETFAKFQIGAVWVAWTESHTDTEANDIRTRGKKALAVLKAVVEQPSLGLDAAAQAQRETVEALLQFYDDEIEAWTPPDAFGAAKSTPRPFDPAKQKPMSCANAITWLRHRAGEANVKYLEPGQIIEFGLNNRLKANVLGPPRTDRLLQLNPSAGASREVYLAKTDDIATLETVLRSRAFGVAGAPAAIAPGGAAQNPFSTRFNRSAADLADTAVVQRYLANEAEGRRIDGEWLGAAESLALKIDGDVNNTSLVLAIEAPGPARHILLFPADAQVGNWLSWHDQRYPAPLPGAPPLDPSVPTESAQDILSRVVLYKVGHHGSHNATARDKGLEMMTSPNLTAMIPVVETVAREQTTKTNADGWAMPYHDLYEPLLEKTRQRTLRGDGDPAKETKAFKAAGGLFGAPAYAKAEAGQPPLWVELRLPLKTA